MHRRTAPPPSKSATRLAEYFDIIKNSMIRQGVAKRYDIYRRAGNEAQTDRVIKYLKENGLMEGDDESGYRLTKKGEDMHGVLKRRDLLSLLTRDLSKDRINRW